MRAIYVPLTEPIRRALNNLAEREYRDPRDQAAMMLTDALRQNGALLNDRSAELIASSPDPRSAT